MADRDAARLPGTAQINRGRGSSLLVSPPEIREVVGAWLVCLAVAVGCFAFLSAAGPGRDGRLEALISPVPTATVAVAEVNRQGRC